MFKVGPQQDGSFSKRQFSISNQGRWIGPKMCPQPLAIGTPTKRTVKRKVLRSQRLVARTTRVTCKELAVPNDLPTWLGHVLVRKCDLQKPPPKTECRLNTLRQSRSLRSLNLKPIDHQLQLMPTTSIKFWRLIDGVSLTIEPDTLKSLAPQFLP